MNYQSKLKLKDNNMQKYREMMKKVCKKWQEKHPNKYKHICNTYINHTERIKKRCIICGKSFETKQYHQKFCSKKCDRKHKDLKHGKREIIIMLSNIFPKDIDVDFHHIHPDLPFVIPLPRNNHQEMNGILEQHISVANEWVDFYFDMDVNKFLYP